jgi:hypothetical protein
MAPDGNSRRLERPCLVQIREEAAVSAEALKFNFDPHDYTSDPVEIAYRNALGDGLERVLGGGCETLPELVAGLNAISACGPNGQRWTEELLTAELRRLAW